MQEQASFCLSEYLRTGLQPSGGTSQNDFFRSNRPGYPHPVCSELEKVVSEWGSVIAVSLNVGGCICIIRLAKHNTLR